MRLLLPRLLPVSVKWREENDFCFLLLKKEDEKTKMKKRGGFGVLSERSCYLSLDPSLPWFHYDYIKALIVLKANSSVSFIVLFCVQGRLCVFLLAFSLPSVVQLGPQRAKVKGQEVCQNYSRHSCLHFSVSWRCFSFFFFLLHASSRHYQHLCPLNLNHPHTATNRQNGRHCKWQTLFFLHFYPFKCMTKGTNTQTKDMRSLQPLPLFSPTSS